MTSTKQHHNHLPLTALAVVAGLITLASIPTLGAAQSAPATASQGSAMASTAAGGGGKMMGTVMQGITLTDAQQKSVEDIKANYQPQFEAAKTAGNRDQMKSLWQQQTADIRKVLTPDQQAVFDKNLAAARASMQTTQGGEVAPH